MAGHSRPKDGVAPLAYAPAIHQSSQKAFFKEDGLPGQARQ
jgi:hypothetical protein